MVQQCREPYLPILLCCFPHMVQPAGPAFPTLPPALVRLFRVLLGQRPSLHNLSRRSPALVRLLRSYYAAVRLPCAKAKSAKAKSAKAKSRRACGSYSSSPSPTGPLPCGCGRQRGLSVLARGVSIHARGLRLRRAASCSRYPTPPSCPSGWTDTAGSLDFRFRSSIPSLHIPLSNASSAASRPPSHGSGPEWFAIPLAV